MFLYAKLVLSIIEVMYNVSEVVEELEVLPESLDEA